MAASLGQEGRVFATLLSVTFFSMARISSLIPVSLLTFDATRLPTVADVCFEGDACFLTLKWAKNLQDTTQGFRVPLLPFTPQVACPVGNLRWLLARLCHLPLSSPLFSFPPTTTPACSTRATGFTISLARDWLGCINRLAGPTSGNFTFHSFRRGACTLAYERGAAYTDLQQLGGWRSDAMTAYLSASTARRRAASCLTNLQQ